MKHLKKFNELLDPFGSWSENKPQKVDQKVSPMSSDSSGYVVGKHYTYGDIDYGPDDKFQVEYIGLRSENPQIHVNGEIGDKLIDRPVLLFKWLEGDNAISTQGRKGAVIALGKRVAKKNIE